MEPVVTVPPPSGLRRRRLRAVMAADVANFSGHVSVDETNTLEAIWTMRRIAKDQLALHGGWLFGLPGDGIFALFESAVDAVRCALATQTRLAEARGFGGLRLRIGVHLGEVLFQDDLPFGEALNIAARLESLADPGTVLISAAVMEAVAPRINADFTERGVVSLKNIPRRIAVFAVAPGDVNEATGTTNALDWTMMRERLPPAPAPPAEAIPEPEAAPAGREGAASDARIEDGGTTIDAFEPDPVAIENSRPDEAVSGATDPSEAAPPEPIPAEIALVEASAPMEDDPAVEDDLGSPAQEIASTLPALWDGPYVYAGEADVFGLDPQSGAGGTQEGKAADGTDPGTSDMPPAVAKAEPAGSPVETPPVVEPATIRLPEATPLVIPDRPALEEVRGQGLERTGDVDLARAARLLPGECADELAEALKIHVGPVARVLVDRYARQIFDPVALVARLGEEIPSPAERQQFMIRARRAVRRFQS